MIFKPRPSWGWVWLLGLALLILALSVWPLLLAGDELPGWGWAINLGVGLLIGLPGLVLMAWFPTLHYELDETTLTLRYGPVLTYRIPLAEIRSIRRRDLAISLWSSLRLPGLALFSVPYADVGTVKMCATAAAHGILLIETANEKYGLTPADEAGLVAALRARMGESTSQRSNESASQ